MPSTPHSNRGFGLLEVLIAVLIFSLGLIGLAGMLVMSTQANHGAFIRTQATFLAQNMADRMRANPIGLWEGDYDATDYPTSVTQDCTATAPCTPAQLATHDKGQWSAMLKQLLPDDAVLNASIKCTSTDGTALKTMVPNFDAKRAPYDGTCVMHITWTERSLALGGDSSAQTFDWVFQP